MIREQEIIIKPRAKWYLLDFAELWRFRELLYIFTWRDIKVRYKQTLLGVAWVIFQPLVSTGVFTIFFGRLAKIPSNNLPYELFVFIGLVFWIFFSSTLTSAANSMIENVNIIKKVYFPREILPVSAIITGLVDLAIAFAVVLAITFYFGFRPSPLLLVIGPLSVLIASFAAIGLGSFLASLNVRYRDVRYVLPFLIQTMLFVTPVIYPLATVRDWLRTVLAFNPMTGVIESMRVMITGSGKLDLALLSFSFASSLFLLIFGLIYFRLTERMFADIA